jgi:hypothetical protein
MVGRIVSRIKKPAQTKIKKPRVKFKKGQPKTVGKKRRPKGNTTKRYRW